MTKPVREHLLARGKLADRANRFLGKAWSNGWLPTPPLDPDAIWETAGKSLGGKAEYAEHAGRDTADVADFRERLERLIASVNAEARLNALGQAMAYGQLLRVVKNRLAFGALWAKRPELMQTALAAPIIVIGHMRSGTTRIHKLLAADPAHSHTRYCEAYHPVPARFGTNRMVSAVELAMLGAINPWLQTIHPMASGDVEEELAWLAGALNHSIYESQWRIPSYTAFSEARDPAPIYREFNRILRTDAAHRGVAAQPRVMKVPAFAEDLDTLLAMFPDAKLIVAERDDQAVHRSAVSLAANQMAIQSDHCDLDEIKALWGRKIDLRNARMTKSLSAWTGPMARLQFDALNEDWEREIRRTYAELGMNLSPKALGAMRKLMKASDAGHHHAHSEQLRRFSTQT